MQEKQNQKVPFDPGYSKFWVSFPEDIETYISEIKAIKSPHQKKFMFTNLENKMQKIYRQVASLYLGCMLWGGYIASKFKNNPAGISGNLALEMPEEELKVLDHSLEADIMIQFVPVFDRDCKYFLNKPFKISSEIIEILSAYKEFALLNNNFKTTSNTSEVKLPAVMQHFSTLSDDKLDILYNKIQEIVNSDKIELILELGFYG